jgi:hypothetical protein
MCVKNQKIHFSKFENTNLHEKTYQSVMVMLTDTDLWFEYNNSPNS